MPNGTVTSATRIMSKVTCWGRYWMLPVYVVFVTVVLVEKEMILVVLETFTSETVVLTLNVLVFVTVTDCVRVG